jgi:hypothetical protein
MSTETLTPGDGDRKAYIKPEIIHELELETRAGSPLGDPLDLFDLTGSLEQ